MKTASSYVIASLLLLGGLASCKKDDLEPQQESFMRATKDQAPWAAVASGTFSKASKQYYIFGQVGNEANSERLTLGFSLPAAPQLTPVQALPALWVALVGGDAVTNSYVTADAASLPVLEITRLDTVAKVMEGRFRANLVREKKWTTPANEVMQFTDGSFRVQYTTVP